MDLYVTLCFLLFGTFLFSLPLLHECKEPKSCTFQVNKTKSCPSNQTEWNKRSKDMNCSKTNGYMCIPNESFTELLEFCYDHPRILILEGTCLYFSRQCSDVEVYNCRNFEYGCPSTHYPSSKIYEYPSCIHVERGCFVAEPFCKRQPPQKENEINVATLSISLGVSFLALFLCVLLFYFIKKRKLGFCKRRSDTVRDDKEMQSLPMDNYKEILGICKTRSDTVRDDKEIQSLLCEFKHREPMDNYKESFIEHAIFNQWKQDNCYFISTKACDGVEQLVKSRNLVIVAGHSGSGKSAIIQHIALKYREQGWTVKRVKKVEDIVDEYNSRRFEKENTICVFNDPLGKEYFDEILNNSWQTYEEELQLYLKTSKIVMSCRNHIICDTRVTRYLVNKSHIINIDDNEHKLSAGEKRQILNKYTFDINLSDKDRHKIIEVERYFPLLCKLYSSKEEYKNKGIEFFTEPVTVLKEEILGFRNKDKGKYCALALLVLFNGDLCISELLTTRDAKYKFQHTLKLCGLQNTTPPLAIRDNLESLTDYIVKKVGDTYHFYHDFVMEVATYVFGTDYPAETIKYADIGFLRKRVKLENCDEHGDSFTIYLSNRYIKELGERLYTELVGDRMVDVVLNPCLRNENVIKVLKKKIANYPEYLLMLFETRKLTTYKHDFDRTSKSILMSKLKFLELDSKVSPLFALIAFCHTELSQYCVNILQKKQIDLTRCSLISAISCNGSIELFNNASKDHEEAVFIKTCRCVYPIHIVSVFHNYELLHKLMMLGANVNQKTDDNGGWTPLTLAVGNNTENENNNHGKTCAERRDKTVQLLLSNGADINLCEEDGTSPLFIACQNGHDSTVQLLLSNGADINLCAEDGASPLFIACQNGYDSTVQLLLSNGADINLYDENGASPLYIACQNGYDSTVQLLLSNGADIILSDKIGASPLYVACENGHDNTVDLLLSNGADIDLCDVNGASPLYVACQNGHANTVDFLLSKGASINFYKKNGASPLYVACQKGYEGIVHLLLSKGADINFCEKNGASPLYVACQHGYDSTVHLLLSNGAHIDFCTKNGASPLYVACQNGHDSTVQTLLNKGAGINLYNKNGASPLYVACQNGYDSTVHLLLSNGAHIDFCTKNGASPLYVACQNGHDSTVQTLLSYGADINICTKNGASPLYVACQNGHHSTVQYLLGNGANINLCMINGTSPLNVACQNGYDTTVHLLLRNEADINVCNENGASPLYVACQHGHYSTVQLLLSYGADINFCMKNGTSPLYIACQNGHDSTVQLLLRNGADISFCN